MFRERQVVRVVKALSANMACTSTPLVVGDVGIVQELCGNIPCRNEAYVLIFRTGEVADLWWVEVEPVS